MVLSDVTVLDLTRALTGPHAAMMFGDLGARVIKVETPMTGDDTRWWGPPFVGEESTRESTYFMSCNRNKESVTAELKSQEGKDFLRRLVARSSIAPYGLFRTADVPVQVAVGSEALWRAFAPLVGLDVHDERFTSNERRVAHRAELIDVEHPTAGPIRLPGPPLRFDDNSYAGDREAHLPPPLLGEYDRGVREWLDELDAGERA